jgi:hypothetical protein
MSHPIKVKAAAIAMLMTGDSDRYVSEQLNVPRRTVRRWAKNDAYPLLRECLQAAMAKRGEDLSAWNWRKGMIRNGPKKKGKK